MEPQTDVYLLLIKEDEVTKVFYGVWFIIDMSYYKLCTDMQCPIETFIILNSQSLDLGYQSGNGFFSFLVFVGSSYGFLYIIYGFWSRKKF